MADRRHRSSGRASQPPGRASGATVSSRALCFAQAFVEHLQKLLTATPGCVICRHQSRVVGGSEDIGSFAEAAATSTAKTNRKFHSHPRQTVFFQQHPTPPREVKAARFSPPVFLEGGLSLVRFQGHKNWVAAEMRVLAGGPAARSVPHRSCDSVRRPVFLTFICVKERYEAFGLWAVSRGSLKQWGQARG